MGPFSYALVMATQHDPHGEKVMLVVPASLLTVRFRAIGPIPLLVLPPSWQRGGGAKSVCCGGHHLKVRY